MGLVNEILKILYYILNISIISYGLYYFITAIFRFKTKRVIKKYNPKYKMAVLIAARNEKNVIGNLIDSLKKQNYPKNLYDIFVIPNNCTDDTEDVAIKCGAKILKCNELVKSKGEVLRSIFRCSKDILNDYDAYCIFDADNIVHKNFLNRMNDTLCTGYKVAQGYRDSKNPYTSWISSCYTLFYLTQNCFFNSTRMNMNWSASINGTGFMISKETIDEIGFETVTMTEDIEFAAICALNNIKIGFVDDAITYDEQPLKFSESWKQRTRWSIGTIQCLCKYGKLLIKTGISNKIPQCIDMVLFFLAPIMQILSMLVIGLYLTFGLINIKIAGLYITMLRHAAVFLVIGYILGVVISLLVLKLQRKNIRKYLKGVFTISIFMLSWVPINIISLYKKDCVWEQIEHRQNIKIEELS